MSEEEYSDDEDLAHRVSFMVTCAELDKLARRISFHYAETGDSMWHHHAAPPYLSSLVPNDDEEHEVLICFKGSDIRFYKGTGLRYIISTRDAAWDDYIHENWPRRRSLMGETRPT